MDTSWLSRSFLAAAAVVALHALPTQCQALTIEYQAYNLADVETGKDLWRYTYQVSGYKFEEDEGFDIYFDQALYGALSNPKPDGGPQWYAAVSSVIVPGLPQIFDAITVVDRPSLKTMFSVDFIWNGTGTPGSQPFDAFRTSSDGGIEVFASGVTKVPEGGPGLLLAGLTFGAFAHPGLLRWLRRKQQA